jgi:hypothetical protein
MVLGPVPPVNSNVPARTPPVVQTSSTVWSISGLKILVTGSSDDRYQDLLLVEKFSRYRDAREVLLANHRTGAIAKAYAETDPAWVDMENGGLEWIRGGQTFVVFSERDGWWRAYVVSRDGSGMTPITPARPNA